MKNIPKLLQIANKHRKRFKISRMHVMMWGFGSRNKSAQENTTIRVNHLMILRSVENNNLIKGEHIMNYYPSKDPATDAPVIVATERDFVKCCCCDDGIELYKSVRLATIAAKRELKEDIRFFKSIYKAGRFPLVDEKGSAL